MKKIYFFISLILVSVLTAPGLLAQVPDGFNYQAVARDVATGDPLQAANVNVRIAILSSLNPDVLIWEEEHSLTTNEFGLFTLQVGDASATKTGGSAGSFAEIDWSSGTFFIRPGIQPAGGSWQVMQASKLAAVPFAMLARDVKTKQDLSLSGNNLILSNGGSVDLGEYVNQFDANVDTLSKQSGSLVLGSSQADGSVLRVVGTETDPIAPLFEVKNKAGQQVFAVYENGVQIHVDDKTLPGTKGSRGGFVVAGFDDDEAKGIVPGTGQELLIIRPDSTRIFVPNTPASAIKAPGSRGGFAVGGFDSDEKGPASVYFNVSGNTELHTYIDVPRMLWYPRKEAFQAGRINIPHVDSVGLNSTAFGYHPMAKGDFSQAFGNLAKATGDNSTAIGNQAVARGYDSYALGSGALAIGAKSFALGSVGVDTLGNPTGLPTMASGENSFALGMGAQATKIGSMAQGLNSTASGDYSLALGYKSRAIERLTASFGVYSNASGKYSLALGYSSDALSYYSVAVGFNAQSSGYYSTGIGYNSNASNYYATAIGYRAKASGRDSYAFGSSAEAIGEKSFAIGTVGLDPDGTPNTTPTKSSGDYSLAMGMGSQTNSLASIAIGVNTLAENNYAVAVGNGAVASGEYSTSLGYETSALGNKSIAIGAYYNYTYYRFNFNPLTGRFELIPMLVEKPNVAYGDYSVSLGNGNTTYDGGLALGSNNTSRKIGAVTIGHTNSADSAYSFAAGYGNFAQAIYGFALGQGLYSRSANSFNVGRYNVLEGTRDEWVETDPLFVVGNGTSSARNNAFTVYKNGNAIIDGDLTVTGTISGIGGTGDGLGSHVATQNIVLGPYWLSGDGGNEGVFVNSIGNVGIKDSSPSYTLDVAGTGRYTSRLSLTATTDASGSAGSGVLEIGGSLRFDNNEIITNTGSSLLLQHDNGGDLGVDNGTLWVDASEDRVGIGTTAPAYTLDVSGTSRATGNITGGAFVTSSWDMDDTYDLGTRTHSLTFSYSKTGKFAVHQSGQLINPASYSATVGATTRALMVDSNGLIGAVKSSVKYKKQIEPITDIDWLYNLNPVTFVYKSDKSNSLQFGLIAEEVEKVYPEFVSYNSEGKPETVRYHDFVAPLIKAVQEQQEQNEYNRDKISMLQKENIDLRSENNELRQRLEELEIAVSSILSSEK